MAAITSTGSGNWSSTTADAPWPSGTVPGAGDTVTIANGHTVTVDQVVSVGADTTTPAINIASGGKLQVLSTVAGNYSITLKGDLSISGTMEIGTTSNPIPSTRTFWIYCNYSASASDGKYGIIVNAGGTLTMQGASMTTRTTLSSSAAAGDDHIHTTDTTGWLNGDVIVIAPTETTGGQYELITLGADASGTTVTLPATLSYNHNIGTNKECEVINIRRNIVISSYNTTELGYIQLATTSVVDVDYVRFRFLGTNTAGKHGISVYTTTGSANFQYCSFSNTEGYHLRTYDTSDNWTFSYNSLFGAGTFSYAGGLYLEAKSSATLTCSYNWQIYSGATAGYLFNIRTPDVVFSYNRAIGCTTSGAYGFYLNSCPATNSYNIVHTCSNGIAHANGDNKTFSNWKVYKNTKGFNTIYQTQGNIFDTCKFFENTTGFITYSASSSYGATFNSCEFYGNETGLYIQGLVIYRLNDCLFGVTSENTSRDIYLSGLFNCEVRNITLSSTNKITYYATPYYGSELKLIGCNIEGTWLAYGYIQPDTSIYKTASPSIRGTPRVTDLDLEIPVGRVAVPNGQAATISCYMRKSVVGDGAAYNGNAPVLIVRKNTAGGITSDTALDSVAGGDGSFVELTGTTDDVTADCVLEFVLLVDGTAGWVNVDDITVTVA